MRLGLSAHVSPRPQIDLPVRAQSFAELVLSHFRTAGISALAIALLSCVVARAGHAERDGGMAADPAQPRRARGADWGSRRARAFAPHRLAQAVSLASQSRQGRARCRGGEAVRRTQ